MTTETNDVPMKYVLFSHISYKEAEDYARFNEWEKRLGARTGPGAGAPSPGSGTGPSDPDYGIVADLMPYLKGLKQLLTDKDNPGILVLFYAKGYAQCLEDIADQRRRSRKEAMTRHPELRCAKSVQDRLQSMFNGCPDLSRRVRVITALDLHDIFSRIESGYAQNLIQWFIGLGHLTWRASIRKRRTTRNTSDLLSYPSRRMFVNNLRQQPQAKKLNVREEHTAGSRNSVRRGFSCQVAWFNRAFC